MAMLCGQSRRAGFETNSAEPSFRAGLFVIPSHPSPAPHCLPSESCECTCEVTGPYDDDDAPCGRFAGFACVDPMAPCVDDDSVTIDMFDICQIQEIGKPERPKAEVVFLNAERYK